MTFNWTCPHCNRDQTVTANRHNLSVTGVGVSSLAEGELAFERFSIGCANPECRRLTLSVRIGRDKGGADWVIDEDAVLLSQRLFPQSFSKPQPDFIPFVLRDDYYEACSIKDLSPKAAATLARRCLQGMIRDFCGIVRGRLVDEITALQEAVAAGHAPRGVTDESVQAIDHVRSIGNIGAHMERDINLIVSVDAGEAQTLIELIEMLFDEWYVAREKRRLRLAKIEQIAADKKDRKKDQPTANV